MSKEEQEALDTVWRVFDNAKPATRLLMMDGILQRACLPHLSYISNSISCLTRIDFISALPSEVSLRIFNYLDAMSLCHSATVSRRWRSVADDDAIWYRMCTQHIDRKCTTCGWGLPLMHSAVKNNTDAICGQKRTCPPSDSKDDAYNKHQRKRFKRPWKDIYAERLVVERNWRNADCIQKDLVGHTDGVTAMYYDESKSLLITGGFDFTLRAWNTDDGRCIGVMQGHSRCIRGIQFDDTKIISCSMDRTLRIWSMKDLSCMRVVHGHNDGVVCLHFTDKLLASGSVDGAIRLTNLAANSTKTLTGHNDWVNRVLILPCKARLLSCSDDATIRLWDIHSSETIRIFNGHHGPVQCLKFITPHHDDFSDCKIISGSLDHTVKVWNYESAEVITTLFGHAEGVWCVDADSLRVVSGSHDNTLKVWDTESGKCMYTVQGHSSAVNCCIMTDTKLLSGDQNGIVTIRDFLHGVTFSSS